MRYISLIFICIFCIFLDLGSKYYFDNHFVIDYCEYEEWKNFSDERSLGWLSPELLCSSDYGEAQILNSYIKKANVSIVWEYITFQLSHNQWIAFSFPIEGIYLKIVTIWLIFAIFFYYVSVEYPKNIRLLDIAYSLIFAGALSNGYERIFKWYVIDFISIEYFAILNFADIFIFIGACILFISYYVRKQ